MLRLLCCAISEHIKSVLNFQRDSFVCFVFSLATMCDRLRLAFGIIGNANTMLLYSTPILTFTKVIRKRTLGDISCLPYIVALLNCCTYCWYGLPIVSFRWENFVMVPINGIGILLELSFISLYIKYGSAREKKRAAGMAAFVILAFVSAALVSAFAIHDHRHRKMLVGSIGLVSSAGMYASPLSVAKKVIRTKSVESMPFHLSFFSFLASTIWMIYGLLSHDFFIMTPNMVGSPLGLFQLMIYCKYRKKGIIEETRASKWDIESKGPEKIKQQITLKDLAIDEKEEKAKQQLQLDVVNTDQKN